ELARAQVRSVAGGAGLRIGGLAPRGLGFVVGLALKRRLRLDGAGAQNGQRHAGQQGARGPHVTSHQSRSPYVDRAVLDLDVSRRDDFELSVGAAEWLHYRSVIQTTLYSTERR